MVMPVMMRKRRMIGTRSSPSGSTRTLLEIHLVPMIFLFLLSTSITSLVRNRMRTSWIRR